MQQGTCGQSSSKESAVQRRYERPITGSLQAAASLASLPGLRDTTEVDSGAVLWLKLLVEASSTAVHGSEESTQAVPQLVWRHQVRVRRVARHGLTLTT